MFFLNKKINKRNAIYVANCCIAFFSIFFNTTVVFSQKDIRREETLHVWMSNQKPGLNEPVTIKVQYEAPIDLEEAIIVLNFAKKPRVKVIQGEIKWIGAIRKGDVITKEWIVSLEESDVYIISVYISRNVLAQGYSKGYKFYPAGAFEIDYRNQSLQKRVQLIKTIIEDTTISFQNKRDVFENKNRYVGEVGTAKINRSMEIRRRDKIEEEKMTLDEIQFENGIKEMNKFKNDSLNNILNIEYNALLEKLPPPIIKIENN